MSDNFVSFEHLIALMPGHVYWLDREGVYKGCNDLQAKAHGFNHREEIVGKRNEDLPINQNHPAITEFLNKVNAQVMDTATPMTLEEPTAYDNKRGFFLSHKVPIFDGQRNVVGLLGISFDISDSKKELLELKEKQEKAELTLESIIANLPGHVYWVDTNNCFLGCNDQQAKAFGLQSTNQIIGLSVSSFQTSENAEAIIKNNNRVIKQGETITEEESFVDQNGVPKIFLSKKIPFRDKNGVIIGLLGISLDITDKRQSEQKLQETQQKLEGMTLVSASIAHETRTPLQSLDAAVGSLKKYFPILLSAYDVADKHKLITDRLKLSTINLLKSIMDSMQREIQLASLVVNLLQENLVLEHAVSRGDNLSSEVFSAARCINESLERYPFKMGQRERIHWQPTIDFKIRGKELLLTHILFNFIKNALHHIAVAETKIAGKKGEIYIWLEASSTYNKLYFKDTGTGIHADKLQYVFERFFTQTEHGAGIGLSYCKAAMEKLSGQITCDSVYGDYTLFSLSFPTITECQENG